MRGGAGKYKVPGARHVLRGSSQVLRGPALIKLFPLERDTREELLEKLRLRYETFFLEANEKIRTRFWYRGKRWKPVGSTGTGRLFRSKNRSNSLFLQLKYSSTPSEIYIRVQYILVTKLAQITVCH